MKKSAFILIVACFGLCLPLAAQHADTAGLTRIWKFTLSGMVSPQLYMDTRQVVAGREEMMLFFPKPFEPDADGNDLNAVPSLNMLAITTRLALAMEGPDVLGARLKGYVEGDFTGATDATINMFRLRHAYIDMRWKHNELLMGQYWYPMTIHEIMPGTRPLNMGAPFHPYARYSQVRYTARAGKFEAVAVAAFQLDNKSQGPAGSSTSYLKHSLVPECNFQLRYRDERFIAGVAYNLMAVKPRDFVLDTLGRKHKVDDRYVSHSFSAFAGYSGPRWRITGQTVLSDNLYEGSTLGGYIEHSVLDGDRCAYIYRPWHYTTAWLDFGRSTGRWRPGCFLGLGINNGSGEELRPGEVVYGRGYDISLLYRVQPRIGYVTDAGLSFWFEVEHTFARYTETAAHPACDVFNDRFILSAVYQFQKNLK